MDTSETYIKMSDCEEIQADHKLGDGDYFYQHEVGYTELYCQHCLAYMQGITLAKAIWLPRQDQLQEMVGKGWCGCKCFGDIPLTVILGSLYFFEKHNLEHCINLKIYSPQSMEQLWLAFVMKEKYNKVWDGGNWMKEG